MALWYLSSLEFVELLEFVIIYIFFYFHSICGVYIISSSIFLSPSLIFFWKSYYASFLCPIDIELQDFEYLFISLQCFIPYSSNWVCIWSFLRLTEALLPSWIHYRIFLLMFLLMFSLNLLCSLVPVFSFIPITYILYFIFLFKLFILQFSHIRETMPHLTFFLIHFTLQYGPFSWNDSNLPLFMIAYVYKYHSFFIGWETVFKISLLWVLLLHSWVCVYHHNIMSLTFSGRYPEEVLLGPMEFLCLVFWGASIIICPVVLLLYTPINTVRDSISSYNLTSICCVLSPQR